MWRVITIMAIIAIQPVYLLATTENSTEEKAKEAEAYLEEFNFKKALRIYSEILETESSNPEYYCERGDIYLTIEKYRLALSDFRQALTLDSQSPKASFGLAQYHFEKNNLDSAMWYVNNAASYTEIKSLRQEIQAYKGKIHLEREEYAEAEINLEEATNSEIVSMASMRDYAIALYKCDKRKKANAILEETLLIFGKDFQTLVNVGFISNEIGNYQSAIKYLDQALLLEPGQPYALSNKAYSLMKTGMIEESLRLVNQSIENDNSNSYAFKVRGDIYVKLGEDKKACKEYRKAVDMGYVLLFDSDEITKLILNTCGSL